MMEAPKVSAIKNSGLQDDHDPSDIGHRTANKPKQEQSQMEGPAAYAPHDDGEKKGQGVVRDERGQEQPADKKRAQQADSKKEQSQKEGPAAYAPHDDGERAYPDRNPAKKKTGEF
jgi:hypothetical protein